MSVAKEEIIAFVKAEGADLCAVAGLSGESSYIKKVYGEYFSSFPTAVSFAIFFPKEVVQEQLEAPTRNYITVYSTINREIDRISVMAANRLQRAGFRSYPRSLFGLPPCYADKGAAPDRRRGRRSRGASQDGAGRYRGIQPQDRRRQSGAWLGRKELQRHQPAGGAAYEARNDTHRRSLRAGRRDPQPVRKLHQVPGCVPGRRPARARFQLLRRTLRTV